MKVLFYDVDFAFLINNPTHPVGGATIQLNYWVKGFAANGIDVYVLTSEISEIKYNDAQNVHILPAYDKTKGVRIIRWAYYRLPSIFKQIKKCRPDVIIQAKASFVTSFLVIICNLLGITFIYRVANDIETDDRLILRKSAFEQKIFKSALKFASAIVCQNQYQAQQLTLKFPDKPIKIIYNPFHFNNKTSPKYKERKYVAWLGIFQSQKNLPLLYEIIINMPLLKFKIAGNYLGKLDSDSLMALKKIKQCKNAELVGYIQKGHVADFLSEAYLLLNTSHYEGFSNTFLEAFATGTPVVTSRRVDPDLIIYKNKLGISVVSEKGFPDAITTIINDPDYFNTSLRCINYVKENHDLKKLSQEYLKFLSNIHKQK